MSAVLSEAEIRARFAVSRDARGLLRTVCSYCGAQVRQALPATLAWFGTHSCAGDVPHVGQVTTEAVYRPRGRRISNAANACVVRGRLVCVEV